MYASQNHVSGHFTVSDQREVSRHSAERYAQVSAATESRRERSIKRESRRQRRSAAVATA